MISSVQMHGNVLPPELSVLSPFLEGIIDKKINQVALNIFEFLMDKFCSNFYQSYSQRLSFRHRVHYFADGAPLIDRTSSGQRVKIERLQLIDFITGQKSLREEEILIDGKRVYFDPDPRIQILWGKNYGTKHIIVTDIKECPELVMIYERETTDHLKVWCINTTQPVKEKIMGGQLALAEKNVFVAQTIAPVAPPSPIYRSLIG